MNYRKKPSKIAALESELKDTGSASKSNYNNLLRQVNDNVTALKQNRSRAGK